MDNSLSSTPGRRQRINAFQHNLDVTRDRMRPEQMRRTGEQPISVKKKLKYINKASWAKSFYVTRPLINVKSNMKAVVCVEFYNIRTNQYVNVNLFFSLTFQCL